MRIKVLFSLLAIVGLLTVIPVTARAEGLKIDLQAWQEKAYAEGLDDSPIGGRLAVAGDFGAFGRTFNADAQFDVTSLNGEAVDFSDVTTLGPHAAFRASAASAIGGNLSLGAFAGFATALDKGPEPSRDFPKEFGVYVQFTDQASGSTFRAGICRAENARASFGAGQVCVSGDVPIGPIRFGGDGYFDLKNDALGRDLLRVRVGVSVPDLVKAVF